MFLAKGMSTIENVMQLVGLIVLFVLILAATYYTTRWIGKTSLGQGRSKNISVIETYKISQNKFIQIVKLGEKYIAVGISKEHIEYLTELDPEQLVFQEMNGLEQTDFKSIFSNLMSKQNLNKKK